VRERLQDRAVRAWDRLVQPLVRQARQVVDQALGRPQVVVEERAQEVVGRGHGVER